MSQWFSLILSTIKKMWPAYFSQPHFHSVLFFYISQHNSRQPIPARDTGELKRPAQDCRLRVPIIAGAAAYPPPAL